MEEIQEVKTDGADERKKKKKCARRERLEEQRQKPVKKSRQMIKNIASGKKIIMEVKD